MKTVNTLLSIGMTAFLFLSFLYYLIKVRGRCSFGIAAPFCALYLCFLLSSVINTGSDRLGRWADSFFFALAPLLMLSLLCSSESHAKRFVSAVTWLFLTLVTLNIVFALFPELYFVFSEWDQEYFIAYHSILCFPLTVGVMFALLDAHLNGHKGRAAAYLFLFFANELHVRAGGALIGMAVIAVYFIPFVRRLFEKWDLLVFIGFVVLMFAVLMWGFDVFVSLPPIKHLIADVLHKELNLSGRTGIWAGVLKDICQRPLLGHGLSEGGLIYLDLGYNAKFIPEGVWVHAHNEFLQTWFEGGVFALLCALGMLIRTAAVLRTCPDKRLTGIFKVTIFSLLLMLQNDQVAYYPWYIAAFTCQSAAVFCLPFPEKAFPDLLDADLRRLIRRDR